MIDVLNNIADFLLTCIVFIGFFVALKAVFDTSKSFQSLKDKVKNIFNKFK